MPDLRTAIEDAARVIKIACHAQEKEKLAADLAAFQQWLEPLLAVDTQGVEPVLFSHDGVNVLREDRPAAGDLEKLRRAASNFEDGFYRVPSIIE